MSYPQARLVSNILYVLLYKIIEALLKPADKIVAGFIYIN